jgi:glycosyltransferase involved in cell wall biosynthesis
VTPEVTVVIPTRDRWPLLEVGLPGVLRQEAAELEVVIVDDGSAQPAPVGIADADDRVSLLRLERSHGVAHARNEGLRAARGEWTAFMDDDDLWAPQKLREQLDAAEAQGGSWAYASAVYVDGTLRPIELVPAPDPADVAQLLITRNVMPAGPSNVVARTALLRQLGGFDKTFAHLDDWDMWIRLALAAPAAACDAVLVCYRQYKGNRVIDDARDLSPELEHLMAKHGEAARRIGAVFDEVGFARSLAWAHRRAGRRRRAARVYLGSAVKYRSAGNVARAAGALLGEPLMRAARLVRGRATDAPVAPEWLRLYAPDGDE